MSEIKKLGNFLLGLSIFVVVLGVIVCVTNKKVSENFEDKPVEDNELYNEQIDYWKGMRDGKIEDVDLGKFYSLDKDRNLHLNTPTKASERQVPRFYAGPILKDGKYVAIKGHNLKVFNDITLDKCEAECDNDSKCMAISYNKDKKICALEDTMCNISGSSCDYISGYQLYEKKSAEAEYDTPDQGKFYSWNDVKNNIIGRHSMDANAKGSETCKKLCEDTDDCTSWQLCQPGKSCSGCYLIKNNTTEPHHTGGKEYAGVVKKNIEPAEPKCNCDYWLQQGKPSYEKANRCQISCFGLTDDSQPIYYEL